MAVGGREASASRAGDGAVPGVIFEDARGRVDQCGGVRGAGAGHPAEVTVSIMKLTFSDERVLAVMAHPDDAELLCAGTLARARAEGAAVGVCVMCQGDKGVGADGQAGAELGQVRKREAGDAMK